VVAAADTCFWLAEQTVGAGCADKQPLQQWRMICLGGECQCVSVCACVRMCLACHSRVVTSGAVYVCGQRTGSGQWRRRLPLTKGKAEASHLGPRRQRGVLLLSWTGLGLDFACLHVDILSLHTYPWPCSGSCGSSARLYSLNSCESLYSLN
jgi:hypothetical protein